MGNNIKGFDFKKYATPRIIGGIAIVIIVLWALSIIFGSPEGRHRNAWPNGRTMRPRQRRIQALPAGINRQMQPTGLRQMPPPKATRPPRRVLPAMAPWLSTKPPKPMARRRLKEQRLLMERSPGKPPRAHPDKKPPAVIKAQAAAHKAPLQDGRCSNRPAAVIGGAP
jgi:hypothetical protein